MFGIEFTEVIRFFMQASAAFAGAASLWGFVFSKWFKKTELLRIFFISSLIGIIIFLALWWVSFMVLFPPLSLAHEGIVIPYSYEQLRAGFEFNLPFVIFLTVLGILGILLSLQRGLHRRYFPYFFLAQFLTISAILSFGIFSGRFDKDQFFFSFHNWHSILTLGTVIVVDILYLASLKSDALKRIIYPYFPFMSCVIWVGLGVDFFSVLFILEEAFKVSSQFLFNQTVVGIIIVNGALLSGKFNDQLISLIKPDRVLSASKRYRLIFGISGSISVISWLTITFLDFVHLTLPYLGMVGFYVMFIFIAFITQLFLKKLILN